MEMPSFKGKGSVTSVKSLALPLKGKLGTGIYEQRKMFESCVSLKLNKYPQGVYPMTDSCTRVPGRSTKIGLVY